MCLMGFAIGLNFAWETDRGFSDGRFTPDALFKRLNFHFDAVRSRFHHSTIWEEGWRRGELLVCTFLRIFAAVTHTQ